MSLPKEPLNKTNPLSNTDKEKIDQVVTPVTDQIIVNHSEQENQSIEKVDLENSILHNKEKDEEILLAGIFPKNFKVKKKTLTDKNAEDLSNKELGAQQQEQLKTKTEGEDFKFEKDTGKAVFADFTDEQLKDIETTLQKFAAGNLDETKKKSLKFIFDELDADIKGNKLLDSNKFSELVTKFVKTKKTVTIKDLMDEASDLNRTDVYLKILKLKEGETLKIPEMVRAVMESKLIYVKLRGIAMNAAEGKFTELDKQQFYQLYRLWSVIYSKAAGDISTRATGMRVIQSIDKPTMEGAEDIVKLLTEELGADFSDEGFQQIAQAFVHLKPFQAGKMVKDSAGRKLRDAWAEIWVNSLLSSPITHAVNMVGNTTFNTLRVAEYAIAAGINKVPGMKSPEGVTFSEVWGMIMGIKTGFRLGVHNGYQSLKTGHASTTKLDLRKPNAVGARLLPEGMQNGYMGKFLELMGTYYRLPGRALVAEDEFMKGIMYRMEIERIAKRNYVEHLRLKPDDIAGAEQIWIKTVNDPDNATVAAAKEGALEGTFQKELPPGILNKINGMMNIPEVKLFMPFYRTITNIFLESGKRNPAIMSAMFATHPKVRADLLGKNGKRVQQLALAKISTGSMMMMGFGMYAYGVNQGGPFMITGMAPFDRKDRETFYRQGLQPYSLCEQKGNTYECTSYARFDPVSSLLAVSADFAYLSSRPDQYGNPKWENTMQNIFQSGLGSIYPYLTSQPFLTGMQELSKIFQPGAFNPEEPGGRAFAFLTEKVTEGALAVVPGNLGSFGRYLQRMSDDQIYLTDFTAEQDKWFREVFDVEGDIPLPIRSFYKALNKAMMQSPFYNQKLRPRVNLWGEEIKGPEFNFLSPVRVRNAKFKKVDEMLVQLGLGLSMPRAYISNIPLNQDEYYQLIKLFNSDFNGNGESDILETLNELVLSANFVNIAIVDADEALKMIRAEYDAALETAQDLFLQTNPKFNARKQEVEKMMKKRIKNRLNK
jgi:hypothetical protein